MAGRESQGPDSRPGEDVGGLSGLTTWRVATLNKLSRSRARSDLVYLDPPFNNQASYNVLSCSTSG